MTYKIRIDPTAFNGSNALSAYAGNQMAARVVIGTNWNDSGILPTLTPVGEIRGPTGIEATITGQTFQDEVFTKVMGYSLKAQLANFVTKGILIVEKDGVAQTAVQIMA